MGMTTAEKNRNGVRQWVFQRISNALIILYALIMLGWFLSQSELSYESTQALFGQVWFKLYTLITLVFVCLNSMLAGWQIAGDYLKAACVNRLLVVSVAAVSAIYFVWAIILLF